MDTVFGRRNRSFLAISFIAAVFVVLVACGSESPGQTDPQGRPVSAAPAATSVVATKAPAPVATDTPTVAPTATDEPDERMDEEDNPELVNTPGPVAKLAPDFTLPSIDGQRYTLSEYRGQQPVLVVFYRAYW